MDEFSKERLVEQFRSYLKTYPVEYYENDTKKTDIFSLFTELAALRNEVKLESRQVKSALDVFKGTFETVQSSQEELTKELENCRHDKHAQRREITRSLLLEFLEVYDRLEAGVTTLNNYKPSPWSLFCKRDIRFIQGLQEGQAMTLRRLDQLLVSYQVYPLEVLNKSLDPHSMRAVEIDSQPDVENGIVTGELRKGFLWKDEVLRHAEVKVNKN
ncbi:nucleotide exchange factor GrpE [Candidatus Parabeggiatoa sp. HSG14]|uniref:nucleotide exchange factor GrpE n=1 Tax=Candidatus Parabeggiatoa sp. HSG14 TaxID=3055593 RepID=UPI0025A741F6|nr:nucleotide exchange factor GrpE [Thiotrichales bacterium HSG14]